MPKGLGECFKAPKAFDSTHWHSALPHKLQGCKELKTTLAAGLEDATLAKTLGTIITHVEADLEETHHSPHLARQMSMDFVSQEHGVPHDGPKDSNTGGCTREILDRNKTE
jgi:hypothetical protein